MNTIIIKTILFMIFLAVLASASTVHGESIAHVVYSSPDISENTTVTIKCNKTIIILELRKPSQQNENSTIIEIHSNNTGVDQAQLLQCIAQYLSSIYQRTIVPQPTTVSQTTILAKTSVPEGGYMEKEATVLHDDHSVTAGFAETQASSSSEASNLTLRTFTVLIVGLIGGFLLLLLSRV